ncbi:MAG: hypothetical protein EXS68_02630 [Candidatus Ryanbacteria bacterium]|nr:hypothetical protein [Candidatus Ryanbacteria bacterium]
MEKAPGPSPESSEEPKPQSERPTLTKKDQETDDYNDRLQAFYERSGEKEVAAAIAAERKDQEAPALARGADIEINADKKEIARINEAVQRGEVIYGENPSDRIQKLEDHIQGLEDIKADREKKPEIAEPAKEVVKDEERAPEVIELTEDTVINRKPRDKYDKTLEGEPQEKPIEASVAKKEKAKDSLVDARPNVRERLMAAGMQRVGTLAERSALVLGGKVLDLHEQLNGYPVLKRERAQKAADECERAIEGNNKDLMAYGGDPKIVQKLRSDREGMERRLAEARLELGKREMKEEKFLKRKRSFEGGMRTFASDVLEKIDRRLAPFERELTVARTIKERSDVAISAIKKNVEAYKADLVEKRGILASIADPVERKNIELEIQRIEGALSSSLPTIDRMVKKQTTARRVLENNEKQALPYRQQQRRFARAAGLEVREDILTKGTPPEDLPVMSKGGLRVIEGGKGSKIKEGVETKEGPNGIDAFIKRWNRDAVMDARMSWRIRDPEHFKYLAGASETLTPMRAEHLARQYFEDDAARKGRKLSPRQYRKAEKIGRLIAGKVFPRGNIIKRAIKKAI